jgi:hypothetical protein
VIHPYATTQLVGGGEVRITGADVDNEALLAGGAEPGETFFDAVH